MIIQEIITNNSINNANITQIEQCRGLCNELMAYQKSLAHYKPEVFDLMNFDTRMLLSYKNAFASHIAIAKENDIPVGYVFSTIDYVDETARIEFPSWAPKDNNSTGFYPDWLKLPQYVGCFSNIYIQEKHKGKGNGHKLLQTSMKWLLGINEIDYIFVFISNGNDRALDCYSKYGFTYSHEVFNGFIKAMYYKK
jgi:GNAT superfamily N-acetyltransferase